MPCCSRAGWLWFCTLVCGVLNFAATDSARAQGVIWQIPADGTWIRFEGTYLHKELRSQSGDAEIPPWTEHVSIKSVGTEEAIFQAKSTKCRWLEIKVERGRVIDGKIDPGLAGLELYKVLIPEASVKPDAVSDDGVPVIYLPVVKGFRQLGKGDAKPLDVGALQLYPLAVLTGHFRAVNEDRAGDPVTVGAREFKTTLWEARATFERRPSRSTIHSQLLRAPEIPFGVGGWDVTILREQKDDQASRDTFKKSSEVTVKMRAVEIGEGAQSEVNAN